jgi:hypothetical protein
MSTLLHQPKQAKLGPLPKDPTECWIFQGTVNVRGYGQVRYGRKSQSCQRWMFEQLFGPVPDGLKVGTTCGNGLCINPYHLVTRCQSEAVRAGLSGVLTPGDIAEIRRVDKANRTAAMADILAGRIGCNRRTIQRVWHKANRGKTTHKKTRRISTTNTVRVSPHPLRAIAEANLSQA